MRRKLILLIALGILGAATLAYAGVVVFSEYESARYTVEQRSGHFELRNYAPRILAYVQVEGDRETAENRGFRLLANYIFGNNQGSSKLAMTTPVTVAPEKIAMTTPVTLQSETRGTWTVTFLMPAQYTLESLPKPVNERVRFVEQPSARWVAARFSGYMTDRKIERWQQELQQWAAQNGLKLEGEPMLAYYDPPWNPPFVRRNEILWRVRD